MITLIKKDYDNGDLTCKNCIWYAEEDSFSYGIYCGTNSGCTHPILYDDDGNIIEEAADMIAECLSNPKHCILLTEK